MILSVDPGLAHVGWALMDKRVVHDWGVVETTPRMKFHSRLKFIRATLLKIIQHHKPALLVMESFAYGWNEGRGLPDVAKAHGAIQTLPLKIREVHANSAQPKSKKHRKRNYKKVRAIKIVKRVFGVHLLLGEHHIADAILQGRYFLTGERL